MITRYSKNGNGEVTGIFDELACTNARYALKDAGVSDDVIRYATKTQGNSLDTYDSIDYEELGEHLTVIDDPQGLVAFLDDYGAFDGADDPKRSDENMLNEIACDLGGYPIVIVDGDRLSGVLYDNLEG